MNETRGRITQAEKALMNARRNASEYVVPVLPKKNTSCNCVMTAVEFSTERSCKCCGRYVKTSFGNMNGRYECESCWSGTPAPAPKRISYAEYTIPTRIEGVCMFCSSPAFFVFNTGECVCGTCRENG